MRVLIDTNVLISAALNPNSVPYQAYVKADVLITGDKDFLESCLKHPVIMTPAEFLIHIFDDGIPG
ncbi:MAG: hypothetical protein HFH41_11550 [Lachnospiraceae bacterium]|nr:hypothetical protein [Lachnospiraceae bacterium]